MGKCDGDKETPLRHRHTFKTPSSVVTTNSRLCGSTATDDMCARSFVPPRVRSRSGVMGTCRAAVQPPPPTLPLMPPLPPPPPPLLLLLAPGFRVKIYK